MRNYKSILPLILATHRKSKYRKTSKKTKYIRFIREVANLDYYVTIMDKLTRITEYILGKIYI